jgi:hypothetical protein
MKPTIDIASLVLQLLGSKVSATKLHGMLLGHSNDRYKRKYTAKAMGINKAIEQQLPQW